MHHHGNISAVQNPFIVENNAYLCCVDQIYFTSIYLDLFLVSLTHSLGLAVLSSDAITYFPYQFALVPTLYNIFLDMVIYEYVCIY